MFCSFKWRELPVRPGPVVPCGGGFGLARGIAVALPPDGSRVPGLLMSAVGNSPSQSTEVKVVAGTIISDIPPRSKNVATGWGASYRIIFEGSLAMFNIVDTCLRRQSSIVSF